MKQEKKRYVYNGPVLYFSTVVARNWEATTFAVSEKQAASNLSYQYKKKYGYTSDVKVTLGAKPVLAEVSA